MDTEVLAQLVLVAVFKTVGSYGNHVIGGFDSHALPPFSYFRSGTATADTLGCRSVAREAKARLRKIVIAKKK